MFLTEQEALQRRLAGQTEPRGVVVAVAKRHCVAVWNLDLLFVAKMKNAPRKKKTTNVAQKYEHLRYVISMRRYYPRPLQRFRLCLQSDAIQLLFLR